MVYEEAHNPCDSKLEENDQCCQFFALYFPVDRCDGSSTRDIKKAKYHQCIGICCPESKSTECCNHGTHTICSCNVLYPK